MPEGRGQSAAKAQSVGGPRSRPRSILCNMVEVNVAPASVAISFYHAKLDLRAYLRWLKRRSLWSAVAMTAAAACACLQSLSNFQRSNMYYGGDNLVHVFPRMLLDEIHREHRQKIRIAVLEARLGDKASPFSVYQEIEALFRNPFPPEQYFALTSTDGRYRFNLEKLVLTGRMPLNYQLILPRINPENNKYSQGMVVRKYCPGEGLVLFETGHLVFYGKRRMEEAYGMIREGQMFIRNFCPS